MGLLSLQFYLIFAIILLVYYLLPGKFQWMWLFAGGIFLYSINSRPYQLITFVVIIIINFAGSMAFEDGKSAGIYKAVIITDIFMLVILKYNSSLFRVANMCLRPFGAAIPEDVINNARSIIDSICPVGMSYFMLILIGYITSVHWGKMGALKNPLKMVLITSYFPLMTSGPIIECSETEGYLFNDEKKHFSSENLTKGLLRILWGVFKKLVISERLALIVNTIYDNYEAYTGLYIMLAAALFTIQLYTDFSGLMDIVLGISRVLGIPLPENFKTPFYASTLAEFWRRWHITLGTWLRNYVFYPLQRSKMISKLRKSCKKVLGRGYEKKYNIPMYVCLFITWFLIGFWHGGDFKYIFGVGIYMGVIIILSDILQPVFGKIIQITRINTECFSYRLFTRIRTFIIFTIGNSFFRASSAGDGFRMWYLAFSRFNPWILFNGALYNLGLDRREAGIVVLGLILLFIVSYFQHREEIRGSGQSAGDLIMRQNILFRLMVFSALFAMIIVWAHYGSTFNAQDFIYGGF